MDDSFGEFVLLVFIVMGIVGGIATGVGPRGGWLKTRRAGVFWVVGNLVVFFLVFAGIRLVANDDAVGPAVGETALAALVALAIVAALGTAGWGVTRAIQRLDRHKRERL